MIATITTNQETFLAMMALVLFAFLTRASVGIHSQNWIKTFSGTMTLFLLPIITFAITSVISGNIALSLGMIGALSIVRFRNPVRSSFELVIFFLMLSLGICAAADMKWLIVLGISSNLIIIGAYFYKNMAKKVIRGFIRQKNGRLRLRHYPLFNIIETMAWIIIAYPAPQLAPQ